MRTSILTLIMLLTSLVTTGQQVLVRGRIVAPDGAPIPFATVASPSSGRGVQADSTGAFRLMVEGKGTIILQINSIGYHRLDTTITLGNPPLLVLTLHPNTVDIASVQIQGNATAIPTLQRISAAKIGTLPVSTGGVEALLKMLPGVSARNELSYQYSVRGGSFEENLVYIDGLEIYRPSLIRSGNQEGLSAINPDMVESLDFSAGGFPANYGDRLSSVLSIRYRHPTAFRAKLTAGLHESRATVEGAHPTVPIQAIASVRYKDTRLLLQSTDTKGDYRPSYLDAQAKLYWQPTSRLEFSLMGGIARNAYAFNPTEKQTVLGALTSNFMALNVYYEGQERDTYLNGFCQLAGDLMVSDRLKFSLQADYSYLHERETYDILAEYWLSEVESGKGSTNPNDSTANVGIGGSLAHARNYLRGRIVGLTAKAECKWGTHTLEVGVRTQQRTLAHSLQEWELLDSAGYTLPNHELAFSDQGTIRGRASLQMHHSAAYCMGTLRYALGVGSLTITPGVRVSIREAGRQLRVSPRGTVTLTPHATPNLNLYLAGGLYYQYPLYRELRDRRGTLHPNLRPQRAVHAVVGYRQSLLLASSIPLQLQAEVYAKWIQHLIPYTINNLQLQYEAEPAGQGSIYGLDLRANAELAPGVESWLSLSVLRAQMELTQPLQNGGRTGRLHSSFPMPSDQLFSGALFLQDYIPGLEFLRVHLTGHLSLGIPFTPPNANYGEWARMPSYRRVDIGFTTVLKDNAYCLRWLKNIGWLREFTATVEVLNLLDIANTASYLWVQIPSAQGGRMRLAVPNYLTARGGNIRISLGF